MPALPFPSGPSFVVQPHAWQIFHFRFWVCFLKEKSIIAENVSKSGAPRISLKRQDKPVSLFSYYILSVAFKKKTFTAIWVLLISTPHPSIEFYYPLWWLLTFDGQGSHSSPQSVIKGISNCTKCYLLGSGTLYIVITCTFVVAFPMFWSLYFKLEDRFHRGQSGIFHCGLCRTLMKQRFNK